MALSDTDKKILNILQGRLQLVARPFAAIAQELGLEESFVIERIQLLKQEGYIRKIGAFFNSDELGYKGCLVALKVQEQHLPQVAEFINKFPAITHNYQRQGEYNLWFTLITESVAKHQEIMDSIKARQGVLDAMERRANHKYKINVQFKLS